MFIYDEEHLRRRCREAIEAWEGGVAYASKAFLCKAMAQLACEEGMAIDVSTGERCTSPWPQASRRPAGPARQQQVRAELGERWTVESDASWSTRSTRSTVSNGWLSGVRRPQVLVRVTPGIEAHTHRYVMTGQDDSKFGFGLASGAAGEAVSRLRRPGSPVEVVGIHAHIGSQIFALESFDKAVAVLAGFFSPLGLRDSASEAAWASAM